MKSLGADEVIDYEHEDFTSRCRDFDVVWDAVGKSTFARCAPVLKPAGIYMSSEPGPRVQNPLLALMSALLGRVPGQQRKRVLFPIPSNRQEDLECLKRLAEERQFAPVIDRAYPLAEIAEAYRYVETGQKVGNVVITVAE